MDLVTLLRTVWRHRLAALPGVVLTIAGLVYVVALSPKTYELTVSQLLLAPPPVVGQDLAAAGTGRRPGSDNPLTRLPSQTVILDLVSRRATSDASARRLWAAGARAEFDVVPSNRYGLSSPIIDVNVKGRTAASTTATAELVNDLVKVELETLQSELGVGRDYMFTGLDVGAADPPRLKTSSVLRGSIAVLAAGGLLVLGSVSLAQGLGARRRTQARVRLLGSEDLPQDNASGVDRKGTGAPRGPAHLHSTPNSGRAARRTT